MTCADPQKPFFLITIDTEGDNVWQKPRQVTTENARCLPRFQDLCERYRLRPTYLTNYEMARSPAFAEFARDLLKREIGEIGMHLHAWDSPPLAPLTDDDCRYHPYLIEYPEPVMREKIRHLTGVLEDTFARKMVSHRAGRWALDARYARALEAEGYRVDCSVTPHVSWQRALGDPRRHGGVDYRDFPATAYFFDVDDIRQPAPHAHVLEVPMTIRRRHVALDRLIRPFGTRRLPYWAFRKYAQPTQFRPRPGNLSTMVGTMRAALRERREHVEFMLHSSELMPGGSPAFPSTAAIERLFADLEVVFEEATSRFQGATLDTFYRYKVSARRSRTP